MSPRRPLTREQQTRRLQRRLGRIARVAHKLPESHWAPWMLTAEALLDVALQLLRTYEIAADDVLWDEIDRAELDAAERWQWLLNVRMRADVERSP